MLTIGYVVPFPVLFEHFSEPYL